ncbi:MAG: PPC domain-containing DNA-binding protein, partial [Thermodesulfobacteriota bacterium]
MVKATYRQGSHSKPVVIRLHPGTDIIEGISEVCKELNIQSGSITTCIGSLQRASFFSVVPMENKLGGGYSRPISIQSPLEIISAQGSIGTDENDNLFIHIHGVLNDSNGNAHGGHLIKGECPVLITSEIL